MKECSLAGPGSSQGSRDVGGDLLPAAEHSCFSLSWSCFGSVCLSISVVPHGHSRLMLAAQQQLAPDQAKSTPSIESLEVTPPPPPTITGAKGKKMSWTFLKWSLPRQALNLPFLQDSELTSLRIIISPFLPTFLCVLFCCTWASFCSPGW